MQCSSCKQQIKIETAYTEINGMDIDYEVENGHTFDCPLITRGVLIQEDFKKRMSEFEKKGIK